MDLNKVMIIGRLTADPEARTTPQGVSVTNFSVATNRVWKDDSGNQQDRVEYHNVVAWRRLAEICAQYLSKGRQIYVEGHLQTRSWEGQDGKKNYRTEVVADNMIMLGSRPDSTSQPAPAMATVSTAPKQQQPAADQTNLAKDEEIRIEDIPF
ncbi:MAG: single-stranded DNA-binding protein [bacterium]